MKILNLILSNIILLIPLFLTILLTFISVLPFFPHDSSNIAPLLGIITVIFWIVNKPDLMSWSSILLVGLINDILLGLHLGTSCLSLLIVRYTIVKLLFKFDNSSTLYTFIYVIVGLSIWLIVVVVLRSLIQLEFFNYSDVFFQFLLSVAVSPIIIFINKYFFNQLKI